MSRPCESAPAGTVLLAAALSGLVAACTLVVRAQEPAGAVVQRPAALNSDTVAKRSGAIQGEAVAAAEFPQSTSQAAEARLPHTVSLRVDGNLAGRVCTMDATGQRTPARARVALVRNGQIVGSTRSDETGHFQVPGIRPGVYSVIAVGNDGFGAFAVHVLPFDRGAVLDNTRPFDGGSAADPSLLDITMVPFSDYQLAMALAAEEMPGAFGQPVTEVPPAATTPEAEAGGGGGGGEGFAPLMGLSGLAGLGAGGGRAGEGPQASPSRP